MAAKQTAAQPAKSGSTKKPGVPPASAKAGSQQGNQQGNQKGNAAPAKARVAPAPVEAEEVVEETVVDQDYADNQADLNEESAQSTGLDMLTLSTEELDAPSRKADANRGHIVAIEEFHSEQKGTPAIRVILHSDDADFDVNWDCYVPVTFENDIHVNPKTLSRGLKAEDGTKIESNEQMQYAMTIHNSKNSATVDSIIAIARAEGRTLEGYGEPVDSFPQFCAALNFLVTTPEPLSVVFRRNPDRNNPRFLRVEDVHPMSVIEDPKAQGLFRNRVKAWEASE